MYSLQDQSLLHINMLEMKAISSLSLTQALQTIKNSSVLVSTDNTTVVAYIRHQGGTHPEHALETQHSVVSQAHTWPVQHLSRPDVQNGQTDPYGVVPESGNCKQGFPDHGISFNRPVRYSSEPQAATICVCVTHTRQEGAINRCSFDGLE